MTGEPTLGAMSQGKASLGSPLQQIAMGMVIVVWPALFPHNPHPEWAVYDALPDPLGWALVLSGLWSLRHRSELELTTVTWLAALALVVSVPLWFPQLNHLLVPKYNPDIEVSGQWFIGLPQTLFGLALARNFGQTAQFRTPRDTFVAGRFGVLTWGFAGSLLLPVIAFGGGLSQLQQPTLLLIGLVNVAFIYYLFRVHRREWLGGPGPLEIHPRPRPEEHEGRPPSS
jgi:hypothetical protein